MSEQPSSRSADLRSLIGSSAYRRLFVARLISNFGNGIAPIALAFGVLDLPGATPTSLSVVLAAQAVPLVILLPLGGVIADRVGRARLIAVSDIVLSGVVAVMAVLFLTDQATVPLLVVLSAISGCLNALWYPAFTGLLPEVVADEHLKTGNAFVSIASNGGLIMGAATGGLLVSVAGPGAAIAVDALSFLLAGLLVLSFRHLSTPASSGESTLDDLIHGWRTFISYRWVVVIVASASLMLMVWRGAEEVMGPVLARESYSGPATWSAVLSAQAAGLLIGGLVASLTHVGRPLVVGLLVSLTLPAWLATMALQLPLPVIALGSFAFGIGLELFYVLWITALQQNIPRESLSRVSSYDAMGSLMLGPVGLAISGPMIATLGLTEALAIFAILALVSIVVPLGARSVRALRAEP